MQIREITVGPVQTRCYILYAENSEACVAIDPGDEPERIEKAAEGRKIAAVNPSVFSSDSAMTPA